MAGDASSRAHEPPFSALVAGDILARKLGVTPWERRLRARIQAVSDRYVK